MITLGISLRAFSCDIGVLQCDTLLDRHVHSFSSPNSEKKLQGNVNSIRYYIQRYKVTAIIVKIPPKQFCGKTTLRLLRRIEALAKEFDCEFDLTSRYEIKARLMLRSANELARYANLLFPELQAHYNSGIANNHSAYIGMYEAILAAHLHQRRLPLRILQKVPTTE